jgi:hypothetical protein
MRLEASSPLPELNDLVNHSWAAPSFRDNLS